MALRSASAELPINSVCHLIFHPSQALVCGLLWHSFVAFVTFVCGRLHQQTRGMLQSSVVNIQPALANIQPDAHDEQSETNPGAAVSGPGHAAPVRHARCLRDACHAMPAMPPSSRL